MKAILTPNFNILSLALTAAFTLTATASFAQAPEPALTQDAAPNLSSSPLAGLYACKSIDSSKKRLACYDAAVSTVESREAKQEIVTIDSKAAKTIKREAFGFSLPSLPKLGLPFIGDSKDDEALEYPVKSVSKSRAGIIITMENGQVWKGVNGRLNYVPKGDLTARISRGAVGSYRLSISNGKERVRGLGVRRIE